MQQTLVQFQANIERVHHLSAIFQVVQGMTTSIIDLSDILRAEVVLSVSVLDHFVHELVLVGMLEIYQGRRLPSNGYQKYRVPLSQSQGSVGHSQHPQWLEDLIRDDHGWKSFQHPDKIAEAIRLISDVSLWEAIGTELQRDARDVKNELRAIVDRRNKIVHEADMDPTLPGSRWPINESDATHAVKFISKLGEAIYNVVV